MKKTHLIPLVLFCIIFLLYTIYFVKVVNTNIQLEPNSIAKTIVRSIENNVERKNNKAKKAPDVLANSSSAEAVPGDKTVKKGTGFFDKFKEGNFLTRKSEIIRYVNFKWLNLREEPNLGSPILEKLTKDDELSVIAFTSADWAHVKSPTGKVGYVARKYLSESSSTEINITENIKPSLSDPVAIGERRIYDIPIITYHYISDELGNRPRNLTLPVKNLTSQLDHMIASGYESITFDDLKDIASGDKKYNDGDKLLMLSFDGGYAEHYVNAAQHLNGKGMKGVFFVDPEKIGTEGYLSWKELRNMDDWGMDIELRQQVGISSGSTAYLKDYIARAKETLEAELDKDIIAYAYPSGKYSSNTIMALKALGFEFARTLNSGNLQLLKETPYQLYTFIVYFPAGPKQLMAWGIE
jgi:peptidoglycan/xylan/chitin deacetylase (PgdA/CDA1 family)